MVSSSLSDGEPVFINVSDWDRRNACVALQYVLTILVWRPAERKMGAGVAGAHHRGSRRPSTARRGSPPVIADPCTGKARTRDRRSPPWIRRRLRERRGLSPGVGLTRLSLFTGVDRIKLLYFTTLVLKGLHYTAVTATAGETRGVISGGGTGRRNRNASRSTRCSGSGGMVRDNGRVRPSVAGI